MRAPNLERAVDPGFRRPNLGDVLEELQILLAHLPQHEDLERGNRILESLGFIDPFLDEGETLSATLPPWWAP